MFQTESSFLKIYKNGIETKSPIIYVAKITKITIADNGKLPELIRGVATPMNHIDLYNNCSNKMGENLRGDLKPNNDTRANAK